MTKTEADLSLMLLKLCEDLLPKTRVAEDTKIVTAMKAVRQHLQAQSGKQGERP